MEHIKSAVKIFKVLLEQGEISKREQAFLYSEYLEAEVQEVLSVFEEEFEFRLLNFSDTVYLAPAMNSHILGIQPGELRRRYFGSNATNKDVYLSFYIMMYIFYEFYSGKNKDPKKTDFIQVSHLINRLDERFERLAKLEKEELDKAEEEYGVNLATCIDIWMNLLVDHETKRRTKNKHRNSCRYTGGAKAGLYGGKPDTYHEKAGHPDAAILFECGSGKADQRGLWKR